MDHRELNGRMYLLNSEDGSLSLINMGDLGKIVVIHTQGNEVVVERRAYALLMQIQSKADTVYLSIVRSGLMLEQAFDDAYVLTIYVGLDLLVDHYSDETLMEIVTDINHQIIALEQ